MASHTIKYGRLILLIKKMKKLTAIMLIAILLPYIITVFINGNSIETSQQSLLDDYCISMLAREVSSTYEDEMLKVQAVIVRTTIYQNIGELKSSDMDISNLDSMWKSRLRRAWEETKGQVLMYNNELALLPFHYLSNGKTRNAGEVLQSDAYPYLIGRECISDLQSDEQIQTKMIDVTDVEIVSTDSAGYVTGVKVGNEIINGDTFRKEQGIVSSCFELQKFDSVTCVITKGVGHGMGLSQYTANEMAKEGKTYQEILQFFYEGTEMNEVAEVLWQKE